MGYPVEQLSGFVSKKIGQLVASDNESWTRAIFASLRRGIGKTPGSMPELWEILFADCSEELLGQGKYPTRTEWAIYTTLTLFGLHQQGKDIKQKCMHQKGGSLGSAVRKLVKEESDENRIKRRFDVAATSDSPQEFAHHMRALVHLFRAQDVPLDYTRLAEDLYLLQSADNRDQVRLRWGRDFYRYRTKKSENDQESD